MVKPIYQSDKIQKHLIADVQRVQETECVKVILTKKMTSLCNVPRGCTSRVQVVDVTVNKLFKNEVRRLFEDHLDKHLYLELCVEGKLSASQRRILMTKWVGQAWKKISGIKESIIRSFQKRGLSGVLDGSKNAQVSTDGIPNYEMPQRFVVEEFKLLDDDNDEDQNASENDENDEFDLLSDQEMSLVVEQ